MSTWNKSEIADLVIVGAGIAGSSVAIACAAKGMKVLMLHREDERCGNESLSPAACKQLDGILNGLGTTFSEVVAWWGSNDRALRSYVGARIVCRQELAQQLRATAAKYSSILSINTNPIVSKSNGGWNISWTNEDGHLEAIRTNFLCDATGRRGFIATLLGGRRQSADNLCCASIPVNVSSKAGTFTESVSDGWWNLCTDGTKGTLAFYSEPHLLRHAKIDMNTKLQQTENIKGLVSIDGRPEPRVYLCNSTRLIPCVGPNWIAVGDAAMTVQPLASAGIPKALRDANLASSAILGKQLEYSQRYQSEFNEYLVQLANQYSLETRWKDSEFWNRYNHRGV